MPDLEQMKKKMGDEKNTIENLKRKMEEELLRKLPSDFDSTNYHFDSEDLVDFISKQMDKAAEVRECKHPRHWSCPKCVPEFFDEMPKDITCQTCKGRGWILETDEDSNKKFRFCSPCPEKCYEK